MKKVLVFTLVTSISAISFNRRRVDPVDQEAVESRGTGSRGTGSRAGRRIDQPYLDAIRSVQEAYTREEQRIWPPQRQGRTRNEFGRSLEFQTDSRTPKQMEFPSNSMWDVSENPWEDYSFVDVQSDGRTPELDVQSPSQEFIDDPSSLEADGGSWTRIPNPWNQIRSNSETNPESGDIQSYRVVPAEPQMNLESPVQNPGDAIQGFADFESSVPGFVDTALETGTSRPAAAAAVSTIQPTSTTQINQDGATPLLVTKPTYHQVPRKNKRPTLDIKNKLKTKLKKVTDPLRKLPINRLKPKKPNFKLLETLNDLKNQAINARNVRKDKVRKALGMKKNIDKALGLSTLVIGGILMV